MKDFSHWKEYEGASEGSGRSEKLWLINPDTNQTGLFKYKKERGTPGYESADGSAANGGAETAGGKKGKRERSRRPSGLRKTR